MRREKCRLAGHGVPEAPRKELLGKLQYGSDSTAVC